MNDTKITWTVHRAREHHLKTALVLLFILLFTIFTYFSLGLSLAIIALTVLAVATHTYFLPVSFQLNSRGITIDKKIFQYTYEWERFRRFYLTSGGVVLSPFTRYNFLDNFRGVHLLLPQNPEPILNYLRQRFPETN